MIYCSTGLDHLPKKNPREIPQSTPQLPSLFLKKKIIKKNYKKGSGKEEEEEEEIERGKG